MKAMKIRKDDHVVLIGGKDRGKTGRVLRTDPKRRISSGTTSCW